jgi:hypothetical protein
MLTGSQLNNLLKNQTEESKNIDNQQKNSYLSSCLITGKSLNEIKNSCLYSLVALLAEREEFQPHLELFDPPTMVSNLRCCKAISISLLHNTESSFLIGMAALQYTPTHMNYVKRCFEAAKVSKNVLPPSYYLSLAYVKPGFRGKKLLTNMNNLLIESIGNIPLFTVTGDNNIPVVKYFTKAGFSKLGQSFSGSNNEMLQIYQKGITS